MKGFKDKSGKFRPIGNKNGVRKSRDQSTKTEGVRLMSDTSKIKCYNCGERLTVDGWCDFCHDYMGKSAKRMARDGSTDNIKKIDRNEWKRIVTSNKSIVDDQRKLQKYYEKVDTPSGFAFSDLDHYRIIEKRLDEKLEKLAKKHDYVPEGYTKYSGWMDHWGVR